MNTSKDYETDIIALSQFAKAISHPARLMILQFLAQTKSCFSGDITEFLPLSRSTGLQHLKELKNLGLIHGHVEGAKVNYCLCSETIKKHLLLFETFFNDPAFKMSYECN